MTAVDPATQGKFPGNRGPDQLIIYTPSYGHPTTLTNEWGYEVRVEKGVVTRVGGNNSPIPPDGFVVSGHGRAAEWMRLNLYAGTKVEYDAKTVRFTPGGEEWMSADRKLRGIRIQTLNALASTAKDHRSAEFAESVAILREIHRLQSRGTPPTEAESAPLASRLTALQKATNVPSPTAQTP